jgi:hypothetical protein
MDEAHTGKYLGEQVLKSVRDEFGIEKKVHSPDIYPIYVV